MQNPPPPLRLDLDKIDERWLAEWVAFGFRELRVYLAHHADFEAWLTRHNRKDPP